MGQQEVYDFLKDNPREWFTTVQIASKVGTTEGSVRNALRGLRKRGDVLYKESFKNGVYLIFYKYNGSAVKLDSKDVAPVMSKQLK